MPASWLLSAGQCQTAAPLPVGSDPRSVPRNEPAHKAPPPSSPALGNYAKGLPAAVVLLRRNRTDRPLQRGIFAPALTHQRADQKRQQCQPWPIGPMPGVEVSAKLLECGHVKF